MPAVGVLMCDTCDVRIHHVGAVTVTHAAGAAYTGFSSSRLLQTDTYRMSRRPPIKKTR